MKKFLFLAFVLLFQNLLRGQVIIEENFDGFCDLPINPFYNNSNVPPFENGDCFESWIQVSGVPDIFSNYVQPFNDKYVTCSIYNRELAVNNSFSNGESFSLNYNFQQDQTYKISFMANKVNFVDSALLVLTSDLISNNFEPITLGIVQEIPLNSEELDYTDKLIQNQWVSIEIIFTPESYHEQLWFRFENDPNINNADDDGVVSGMVFIDEFKLETLCKTKVIYSDLTACSSDLDYGFISVMTDIGNTVEWEYPSENAVDNYNPNTGEILLTNALPGEYVLTISNDTCNSITKTFIIEESCCEEYSPCPIPDGLELAAFIDFPNNDWYAVKLAWNYVSGSQGYLIEIVPAQIGGFDCDNGPNIITPIEVYTETNNWIVNPQKLEDSCFAWRVKAICEDGSSSDYSPYYSFDNPYPSPN